MTSIMQHANLLTRAEVVAKRSGWVESKEFGDVIGMVRRDTNAVGQELWRAFSGDVGSWQSSHADAVQRVVELHNMQEKARLFDLVKGQL